MFERITKAKARKLFDNGTVYIVPSKVYPSFNNYNWIQPIAISGKDNDPQDAYPRTFDSIINEFKYYNCNEVVGNCVHYYTLEN